MTLRSDEIKWAEENIVQDNEIRWSEKLKWNGNEFEAIPKRAPGEDGEAVQYFCHHCGGYFEDDIHGHVKTCMNVERAAAEPGAPFYLALEGGGGDHRLEWAGSDEVEAFIMAKKMEKDVVVLKHCGVVRNETQEETDEVKE